MFLGLSNIEYLYCLGNEISSLDVSTLDNLVSLKLDNNSLAISSLKTAFDIQSSASWSTNYTFSAQDSIFTERTLNVGNSVDYSQEASAESTSTVFKWYINDALASSSDVSNNAAVFTFNKVGTYHCEMTNAKLPSLTLRTKKIKVQKASPTVTWPSLSDITYGDTLKTSTMSGAVGTGTFSFRKPDTVLRAGIHQVVLDFTPQDATYYISLEKTIDINVLKKGGYITNFPSATPITYGDKLSVSTLSGSVTDVSGIFKFKNPDKVLVAGAHTEPVVFTPNDALNYSIEEMLIPITVNKKATLIIQFPNISEAEHGQSLAEVTLTGGKGSVEGSFVWEKPSANLQAGKFSFKIVFIPKDTSNFKSVEGSLDLSVDKLDHLISWLGFPTKLTQGEEHVSQVNSDASGDVTLSATPIGLVKIVGNKIIAQKSGVVNVHADHGGDDAYHPASRVTKTLSIEDKVLSNSLKNKFKIYPNPSFNKKVKFKGLRIGDELKLFDTKGGLLEKIIVKKLPFILNLKTYPSGLYILQKERMNYRLLLQ